MGISENRKNKAERLPAVSKARRTRRLPVKAVLLHGYPFNVKATQFPRRRFLHLAAGAAALPAVSRIASAQAYPARPVRIILGFPPGGMNDITARLMGQWLSERLGQPFIIENRPGAGGNIGAEAAVRAPPDGYTLLLVGSSYAINATLYEKLNLDFVRDIAPVAGFSRGVQVMEQIKPRQAQHGVFGQRKHSPRLWRAIQDDDRREYASCAVSRLPACADRPAQRASASHVR